MPNQWNNFFNQVFKGGENLAQGLIQNSLRNRASEDFNSARTSLMDSYNRLLKTNQNMLETADSQVNQSLQGANQDTRAGMLNNYIDAQSKLRSNPMGQTQSQTLEELYKSLLPNTTFKLETHGDKTYKVTPNGYEVIDQKKLEKDYVLKDVTLDDGQGGYITKQMWVNKNDPMDRIEEGSYTTPKEEPKPLLGRRGGIGRIKNPLDDMNNKEKQLHTDLEAYRSALGKDDARSIETVNRIGDKYANLGMNIDDLNNQYDYTGKDLKKQAGFLKEKVRQSEQINEAYNQTYKDLQMDNWWNDLYNASDINDFNNRIAFYEDYMQKSVFPQVSKEIGAKLWSELQKAKAKIYNDKGFK